MAKNLRIPSYRLHSTGQAVVRIKGRDFYLGPYDSPQSRRAYQEIIGKYLLTGEAPAGPPRSAAADDDSPTMAILADKYLDHARTYYGEKSTEFRNSKLAMKPMVMLYGDKYASGFGPVEFRGCRDWWLQQGVSRGYINSQMKRLKRCLGWCVSFGMFPATRVQEISCIDPLKKGRTTAKERDPVKPVSDAVVEQTLPHMPPVVADMVRLQRLVGCPADCHNILDKHARVLAGFCRLGVGSRARLRWA